MYILLSFIGLIILVSVYLRFFTKKHTLVRNYLLAAYIRYMAEKAGPPARQYWIQGDREGGPYNRVRRSYVYAAAKGQNRYRGFGSDDNQTKIGHLTIPHSPFPTKAPKDFDPFFLPATKVIGLKRKNPVFLESIINVSAMSYGSTSDRAVMANNIGTSLAGAYQNTGEGGIAPYHDLGGKLVYQIGTGYFGCRDKDGNFSLEKLLETLRKHSNVIAIEIKLSQGAKAGKGGMLLGSKVNEKIADIRGIEEGKDCMSPAWHSAFDDIQGLVEFCELIANETGLPVGVKFAVGEEWFPNELARIMHETQSGPDFIAVDGGEGGTGAAPAAFSDHVGLLFEEAFPIVYKAFQKYSLTEDITFIGSAKLGYPPMAIKALAMGVDVINVAREALFAIGCLQTQDCHKGTCPVGIATHNRWLVDGLNIEDKSTRLALYLDTFKKDVWEITHACGKNHPAEFNTDNIRRTNNEGRTETYSEFSRYKSNKIDVDLQDLIELNKSYNGDYTLKMQNRYDKTISLTKALS